MSKSVFMLLFFCLAPLLTRADWKERIRQGLPGKVTFEILDENRSPVACADVEILFCVLQRERELQTGKTDDLGHVSFEGRSNTRCPVFVKKEGYYSSKGREYSFTPPVYSDFKEKLQKAAQNGAWEPWNQTNTIIIKKQGQALALPCHECQFDIKPGQNEFVLDLESGKIADSILDAEYGKFLLVKTSYNALEPNWWQNYKTQDDFYRFSMQSPCLTGGFVCLSQDKSSEYQFSTQAPKEGYTNEIEFYYEKRGSSIVQNQLFDHHEKYLVYKTSKENVKNNQYAIITQFFFERKDDGMGKIHLQYYWFPPRKGDSIEFTTLF